MPEKITPPGTRIDSAALPGLRELASRIGHPRSTLEPGGPWSALVPQEVREVSERIARDRLVGQGGDQPGGTADGGRPPTDQRPDEMGGNERDETVERLREIDGSITARHLRTKLRGPVVLHGQQILDENYNQGGGDDYITAPRESQTRDLNPTEQFNALNGLVRDGIARSDHPNPIVRSLAASETFAYLEDQNHPGQSLLRIICPNDNRDASDRSSLTAQIILRMPTGSLNQLLEIIRANPRAAEQFYQISTDGVDVSLNRLPRDQVAIIDLDRFIPVDRYPDKGFFTQNVGTYKDRLTTDGLEVYKFSEGGSGLQAGSGERTGVPDAPRPPVPLRETPPGRRTKEHWLRSLSNAWSSGDNDPETVTILTTATIEMLIDERANFVAPQGEGTFFPSMLQEIGVPMQFRGEIRDGFIRRIAYYMANGIHPDDSQQNPDGFTREDLVWLQSQADYFNNRTVKWDVIKEYAPYFEGTARVIESTKGRAETADVINVPRPPVPYRTTPVEIGLSGGVPDIIGYKWREVGPGSPATDAINRTVDFIVDSRTVLGREHEADTRFLRMLGVPETRIAGVLAGLAERVAHYMAEGIQVGDAVQNPDRLTAKDQGWLQNQAEVLAATRVKIGPTLTYKSYFEGTAKVIEAESGERANTAEVVNTPRPPVPMRGSGSFVFDETGRNSELMISGSVGQSWNDYVSDQPEYVPPPIEQILSMTVDVLIDQRAILGGAGDTFTGLLRTMKVPDRYRQRVREGLAERLAYYMAEGIHENDLTQNPDRLTEKDHDWLEAQAHSIANDRVGSILRYKDYLVGTVKVVDSEGAGVGEKRSPYDKPIIELPEVTEVQRLAMESFFKSIGLPQGTLGEIDSSAPNIDTLAPIILSRINSGELPISGDLLFVMGSKARGAILERFSSEQRQQAVIALMNTIQDVSSNTERYSLTIESLNTLRNQVADLIISENIHPDQLPILADFGPAAFLSKPLFERFEEVTRQIGEGPEPDISKVRQVLVWDLWSRDERERRNVPEQIRGVFERGVFSLIPDRVVGLFDGVLNATSGMRGLPAEQIDPLGLKISNEIAEAFGAGNAQRVRQLARLVAFTSLDQNPHLDPDIKDVFDLARDYEPGEGEVQEPAGPSRENAQTQIIQAFDKGILSLDPDRAMGLFNGIIQATSRLRDLRAEQIDPIGLRISNEIAEAFGAGNAERVRQLARLVAFTSMDQNPKLDPDIKDVFDLARDYRS